MFRVVAATAAFLLALASTSADKLEQHSFEPPYTDVDPSGNRLLSKDWKNGGVASVSQSFVRLTPDRQSKKGAVWSRKSLGTDTFSTILKFRISGQGKKFFGDGMALWVMQQGQFSRGPPQFMSQHRLDIATTTAATAAAAMLPCRMRLPAHHHALMLSLLRRGRSARFSGALHRLWCDF
mmetsp:Transcript_44891/g.122993  ORF Transcript_44891/g.122993 Transcript_44891/m.122993 type:complete len:180 (-) Transcript_44891:1553-2092(-)